MVCVLPGSVFKDGLEESKRGRRMAWRVMTVKLANVDETEVYLEGRIVEVGERLDVNSEE